MNPWIFFDDMVEALHLSFSWTQPAREDTSSQILLVITKALPTWYPYSSLLQLMDKIDEVTQQGDLPTTPELLIMENGVLPVKPMLKCLASPVSL